MQKNSLQQGSPGAVASAAAAAAAAAAAQHPHAASPPPSLAPAFASGSTSVLGVAAVAGSGRAPLPPLHPPPFPPHSSASSLAAAPLFSSSSTAAAAGLAGVGSLLDFQHKQHHHLKKQQQQQQQQQEHHHVLNPSSSSPSCPPPSSLPHFGDAQQVLLPAWQQQHHQLQQQQQAPHLLQFRQSLQHFRRSSQLNDTLLTQQAGGVFQVAGGGNSSGSGSSGPQSMLLPTRPYTDVVQQQMPMHASIEGKAVNEQVQGSLQNHAYLQAMYSAQKKVQANMQQGKTAFTNQAACSDEFIASNNMNLHNLRQIQARQGQTSNEVYSKGAGQFVSSDTHMDQMHDIRNDMQSQQSHVSSSPNIAHIVRPASGTLQSQQHLLMHGHSGVSPLHNLQSHSFDPNSGAVLTSHPQYISPQLLPHLQAHLAAMQKAGDVGLATQKFHPALKSHVNASSSGQDLNLTNRNAINSHGIAVPEGLPVPGMLIGKARPNIPSGVVSNSIPAHAQHSVSQSGEFSIDRGGVTSNPNLLNIQHSASQHGDFSLDRGVVSCNHSVANAQHSTSQPGDSSANRAGLSMNRSPQTVASAVPALASKSPCALPSLQKMAGTMAQTSSEQSQLHHPRPVQQLPKSNTNGMDSPTSNGVSNEQNPQSQHPQPQRCGFTRQQLVVLKAQILAFRRLKRGERTLALDVLQSIGSPTVAPQPNHYVAAATSERNSSVVSDVEVQSVPEKMTIEQQSVTTNVRIAAVKEEGKVQEVFMRGDRKEPSTIQRSGGNCVITETPMASVNQEESHWQSRTGPDSGIGQCSQMGQGVKDESGIAKMSTSNPTIAVPNAAASEENGSAKKMVPTGSHPQKAAQAVRRYRGPLYDFPPLAKKVDGALLSSPQSIPLCYDVRQLLLEEGIRVVGRKRAEKLKMIDAILASSEEKKQLPTELVLKLRIEQRKLRLMDLQAKIREEVEQQQQEIMAMGERGYRKFVRLCERQRADLARQVLLLQKATRERHLKSLLQWRKRLLEAHWAGRDARTTRNRGVAKYHERMLREFSKKRDEDRNRRMEALKNNDVDTYREMLKQQQTQMTGDAGERFEVLSAFLTQTEDYLHKLGGKISAVKLQQEREEAALAAALAARTQGLSEEDIAAAATEAMEEVEARNQPLNLGPASVNKYYSLAHAVNERVVRQPSMLRAGILRDYQLVGLQWMLSLYNNRLNGILADEMGLGKTVQVMALIAYLMEFKGNYGPHLIIVPNAVIVNWKSELLRWLPSVSCIFYVGQKDQRTKLYTQEVCALKFNLLVTTYEFVMRDRAKLSKVDWKYIVIDEAQRMKDRESRLSRDLDRFRCQRRLLLTGTPLQNDLRELWSLLNLLLPEVFDNSKSFHDWFSTPFQKDGSSQSPEDDWMETEKKVIVIHRLHQILEPFMLRRRVEDVEGSLPPKVSVVLRCKMSALQAAIYDWIKTTGTIRLDPEDEAARVAAGNNNRQMRAYAPLQNKCMELRKVCNHPFLNYPSCGDRLNEFAVRSCGKLWMLDRVFIKLHRTGHRVLLFSTMTKLLDILEEYLLWRGFIYRRIDGTTTLESRESAIVDFNKSGSDCFIFLLSIRAAGRGLNLQSADTVVIYDPDPNPKNEEQAVARAHRIGQKREVRVIYMEAVVETITSHLKEDELRNGGTLDVDDEMAGKDRYVGSVESLVRSTIQQHKIDMADEVINAGRFDQRTTQEERRLTLEALLHDEERYQEWVHDVPSMQEVNRMIARTEEEVELFDQMDEEYDWPGEMLQHHQVPKWLRVGSREVNAAMAAMSRQASKKGIVEAFGTVEEEERLLAEPFVEILDTKPGMVPAKLPVKGKRVVPSGDQEDDRGRIEEVDQEHEQRGEMLTFSDEEEEGEIREDLEEEEDGGQSPVEQEEGEVLVKQGQFEIGRGNDTEGPADDMEFLEEGQPPKQDTVFESSHDVGDDDDGGSDDDEEDDGDDDSGGDELERAGGDAVHTPPPSQKFGSLAALDSRPTIQQLVEELEEGEIVASGDSPLDAQVSESWAQEKDDGEEQVVQPRTKRKRSARHHCKRPLEKFEETGSFGYYERKMLLPNSYQFPQWPNYEIDRQYYQYDRQMYELDRQVVQRFEEVNGPMELYWRADQWGLVKRRHLIEPVLPNMQMPLEIFPSAQSQQCRPVLKHSKLTGFLDQDEDVNELARENMNSKVRLGTSPNYGGSGRMPENTQKKCKAVLQKLQGAVNKDGRQIATLFELPKRNEIPEYHRIIASPIDARTIEQHLDRFDYGSVLDFAADVQLMLDNATRYYNSAEVKADARRLQALFFQRMGLNFPDVDFSSVKTRSLATLSQPFPPGASPRQPKSNAGVGKAQEQIVLDRQLTAEDNMVDKGGQREGKKIAKDNKVRFMEKSMERDKGKAEETVEQDTSDDEVRHPVDLVFCKKKRKDREKVANKIRIIGVETDISIPLGSKIKSASAGVDSSGNPKGRANVKGARSGPARRGHGMSQSGSSKWIKVSGSLGSDQWLTPVKKLRTDSGKRRPSHL